MVRYNSLGLEMGPGTRRAFRVSTIPSEKQKESCPNTPIYTQSSSIDSHHIHPNLQCRTTTNTPKGTMKSPSSSPRSPFSIFKNTLRLSRSNRCGICLKSIKSGQGMAIYTAECSHAFHFPCITDHVTKHRTLTCPVCDSTWTDVTLLSIQTNNTTHQSQPINNYQQQSKPQRHVVKTKPFRSTTNYQDDESLLSPPANLRFVPIPEEEEENEEFRGFLVNPISSHSYEINGGDSRDLEVKIMPEVAVVSVSRNHQTYAVALKVKGPPPSAAAHRSPIDLVAVLDVGLSMNGAKIKMLKRAMRLVVSSLGSVDRLSIIAFSARADRLLPLRRMTANGQKAARRIIDRLSCSHGTSVGVALKNAEKVLDDRLEKNPAATIMLLSDSYNENDSHIKRSNSVHETGSILPLNRNVLFDFERFKSQSSNEATTSTPRSTLNRILSESSHVSLTRFTHLEISEFGFGGERSYSHEPTKDEFTKCVTGLISVVVKDLRIQLCLGCDSDPGEISAVYSCNEQPTVFYGDSFRLENLYAEEERKLLVELKVPKSTVWAHHVILAKYSYRDPISQELINGREQTLLVPRNQSTGSKTTEIKRLKNIFMTTRAIAESRRLMEHKEWSMAYELLTSARAVVLQSSLICSDDDECIVGLEAKLRELEWRRCYQRIEERQAIQRRGGGFVDENGELLTPTSAWRAAERLANVAKMRESLNRNIRDLYGFEKARF